MEVLPSLASVLAELLALGVVLPAGPVRIDGYGDSEALSNQLISLIRSGKKRAGTGLVWALEAEQATMPHEGDIEVVLDHHNRPALVTQLQQVFVVPYNEVTAEYAAIEGEGDGSLEYWREAHWAFFSRECSRIGRIPSENMPVICSVFKLLNVLPHAPVT